MRKHMNMGSMGFVVTMRLFVFYVEANAIWLVNTELLNFVQNPMDVYVVKFVFNLTAIFAFMSYMTAVLRKKKPVPQGS